MSASRSTMSVLFLVLSSEDLVGNDTFVSRGVIIVTRVVHIGMVDVTGTIAAVVAAFPSVKPGVVAGNSAVVVVVSGAAAVGTDEGAQ